MGGEKLNIRKCILTAVLLLAVSTQLILTSYPLSAQEIDEISSEPGASVEAGDPAAPAAFSLEQSVILGEEIPNAPTQQTASGWIVFRMVLVLALSALAIYGVVFFVKRLARPKQVLDPHLKVLATTPLGNGAFAAVVSVGSKAWLVGGGDGGLSLISEIDEQEALESMLIDDAARNAEAQAGSFPDFRSLMRRFTKSPAPKAGASGSDNPFNIHAENLRKQRDRIGGL